MNDGTYTVVTKVDIWAFEPARTFGKVGSKTDQPDVMTLLPGEQFRIAEVFHGITNFYRLEIIDCHDPLSQKYTWYTIHSKERLLLRCHFQKD